jgi:hypothetical protein
VRKVDEVVHQKQAAVAGVMTSGERKEILAGGLNMYSQRWRGLTVGFGGEERSIAGFSGNGTYLASKERRCLRRQRRGPGFGRDESQWQASASALTRAWKNLQEGVDELEHDFLRYGLILDLVTLIRVTEVIS